MRVGQIRKRDANEKAIIDALRKLGAHVTMISGEGAPDLLVRFLGGLWAFEVKAAKGKRTDAQTETSWPIIRSVDDALNCMVPMRKMKGLPEKSAMRLQVTEDGGRSWTTLCVETKTEMVQHAGERAYQVLRELPSHWKAIV